MTPSKRIIAGAAVAVVAAGAGGAAYAATSSGPDAGQAALLGDAAKRLGVQPAQLRGALQQALFDRLDAAVKAGRLTQQQADAIKQRIQAGGPLPLGGPGFHRGRFFGVERAGLRVAASYLGLTPAELRTQLAGGKTLAQVAGARNKSVSGLEQALRNALAQRLDKAVAAGRITAAQKNRILSRLSARIDDLVNGRLPAPPMGAGPRAFHGQWGPGPAGDGPPGGGPPPGPVF